MSAPPEPRVEPFLKWAGGKRWLVSVIGDQLNGKIKRYYEPFLGSGAMYFHLAPAQSTLSDSNVELVDTYNAIKTNWRRVADALIEHQQMHSAEHYYAVRDTVPSGKYARAGRFIYLNRTCWNGLYRVNLRGEFNVPKGTKSEVVLGSDDFKRVAQLLSTSLIVASDFEEQIDIANRGDFVFVDPPYTVRHQFNGFIKYNEKLFSWSDQERLAAALRRAAHRGVNLLLSNADHESIRTLYERDFFVVETSRFSSISGKSSARGQYSELLVSTLPLALKSLGPTAASR